MSGSAEGALRTAAKRVGLSPSEYLDRVNAGLRWCYRDQDWEPIANFGRDRSRMDGLERCCRRSRNAAARSRHVPSERPREIGRRRVPARDGDQQQARRRIDYLISIGHMSEPNDVACTDCGHEFLLGQRRHEYDHHLGYAAEHHEHVEAVCTTCHHARESRRRAA